MIICIPMAGMSSRFTAAGYQKPKYMLDLHGFPVFDYAISSFKAYFNDVVFIFVGLRSNGLRSFVSERCRTLGVRAPHILELENVTLGQAQTVSLGLENCRKPDSTPLVVFNIDSFRPNFRLDKHAASADGYLETFEGEGDRWSFVLEKEGAPGEVMRVAEKERISPWCSNGLYYFRSVDLFSQAYADELASPSQIIAEHYIAPLYNQMLRRGCRVKHVKLTPDGTIFCGVPDDYEYLKKSAQRELLANILFADA